MREVSYWGEAHDNLPYHTDAEPNDKFIILYVTKIF